MTMNPRALPFLRLAVGAGAWALPQLTGTLFGFQSMDNQEAVYLGRLFGARDVILGVGLLSTDGDAQRLWWRLGIVCDVADAAAGVIGFRAGAPKRGMVLSTATAASAVAMGVAGLRAVRS